jgi:hypothetical protein
MAAPAINRIKAQKYIALINPKRSANKGPDKDPNRIAALSARLYHAK